MWSFFSKGKINNSVSDQIAPTAPTPLPKTESSTPQSSEEKEPHTHDEVIIDAATDPAFIATSGEKNDKIRYHSEVSIQVILNHLKQFDGAEKTKMADAILKELAGLMIELPIYQNNSSILRAVSNTIKEFGSPNIVKYVNKRNAFFIRPEKATILPSLFEDFEHAFLGNALDKRNSSGSSPVR